MFKCSIRLERLMLAIAFVFVMADCVPHPELSQGILATAFSSHAASKTVPR